MVPIFRNCKYIDMLCGWGARRAIVERVFDAAPRPFCDGGCGATKRRVGQKSSAAPGSLSAKKRALCSRAARDGEDADVDGDDTAVSSEAEDSLSYADFVYFMLSEEDKGNEASINVQRQERDLQFRWRLSLVETVSGEDDGECSGKPRTVLHLLNYRSSESDLKRLS